MAKKIVIKISIHNEKDKKNVMKTVAKLEGINEMSVDSGKGTLTVLGDVDPVCIVTVLRRKCCRYVEIETIGPPKPPEKKPEQKDKDKDKDKDKGKDKETPKWPITYCPPPCPPPCTSYPCTCDDGYDPRICSIT